MSGVLLQARAEKPPPQTGPARRIGGADLLVHFSEIQGGGYKSLEENQRVQFEVGQGQKGPQATGVSVI